MLKTFMSPGTSGQRAESTRSPAASPSSTHATDASEIARDTRAPSQASSPAASQTNDEGSKLTVGPNIKLKGSEITDCEILVVEGRVEASMNSRDIRIAEGGVFAGRAEIDVAEIRGTFEGDLIARKRLVVYATGRVQGTIRYGAMMVEAGGVISGNIGLHTVGAQATIEEAPRTAEEKDASEDITLNSPRSLVRGRAA